MSSQLTWYVARAGGILAFAKVKSDADQLTEPELAADVNRLLRASRARARQSR